MYNTNLSTVLISPKFIFYKKLTFGPKTPNVFYFFYIETIQSHCSGVLKKWCLLFALDWSFIIYVPLVVFFDFDYEYKYIPSSAKVLDCAYIATIMSADSCFGS